MNKTHLKTCQRWVFRLHILSNDGTFCAYMISFEQLHAISKMRIKDASILFRSRSFDGSLYLCGYAIEVALKGIVCRHLNLTGEISRGHLPSTKEEFDRIAKVKTHNLDELLAMTPIHISTEIKSKYLADWSNILKWNPELRYAPIRGNRMKIEAETVITSARRVLRFLWKELK